MKNKGITLIALVITIIVLLIFAGVSIAMLTGQNGILNQANKAKVETESANVDEHKKLAQIEANMNLEDKKYTDKNGKTVTIPAGFAVSNIEEEKIIDNGLVVIDKNGNEWIWIEVPKINQVYQNSGLQITQFNDEECNAIYNDLRLYTASSNFGNPDYIDIWHSKEQFGLREEEYNNLKKLMLKNIYQNEGFFIGRYEVGTDVQTIEEDATRNAYIQQNKIPYTKVTCAEAQMISSKLSFNNNKSGLMFGIQWDLTLKYLQTKSNQTIELFNINSSTWGNFKTSSFDIKKGRYTENPSVLNSYKEIDNLYKKSSSNSVLFTTGVTDRNSYFGIYDLAGNVWEWTLESYKENQPSSCIYRGGSYSSQSQYVSSRLSFPSDKSGTGLGFRAVLY